jgi:hypothetical protein
MAFISLQNLINFSNFDVWILSELFVGMNLRIFQ